MSTTVLPAHHHKNNNVNKVNENMLLECIKQQRNVLESLHTQAYNNIKQDHTRRRHHQPSQPPSVSLFKLVYEAYDALNKHPPRHALAYMHIFHAIHLLKVGEPVVPASVRKKVIHQLNAIMALNNQIAQHENYIDDQACCTIQPLDPQRLLTYQQMSAYHTQWSCKDCDHEWNTHYQMPILVCPMCDSANVIRPSRQLGLFSRIKRMLLSGRRSGKMPVDKCLRELDND